MVLGLGSMGWDLWFWVQGLWFRVWGLELRVWVEGLGFTQRALHALLLVLPCRLGHAW